MVNKDIITSTRTCGRWSSTCVLRLIVFKTRFHRDEYEQPFQPTTDQYETLNTETQGNQPQYDVIRP